MRHIPLKNILFVALTTSLCVGCSKKESTFYGPVLSELKDAGFNVEKFDKAAAKAYAATQCVQGKVDKLNVLICDYTDSGAAASGQKRFKKFLKGAVSGAIRQHEKLVMVVADHDKVDPSGTRINKLLKTFTKPPT